MRLRLDIGYDGTDFHGWATQPGLRTVQGEIEAALGVLLRVEPGECPPRLVVGGRTDAGVHARGQVAHLDVADDAATRITPRRLGGVLARRGSSDVVVHAVREVAPQFDARFGALRRSYEYRLLDAAGRRDPLAGRFTAVVPQKLDFAAMQHASKALVGLNDFTTFCRARDGATAVRELLRFEWRRSDNGAFVATVEADAFCHSMVRALVGAVVAVGSARISHADLLLLRDARERTSRFAVMPAHGLSLEEIVYPPDEQLAVRVLTTRARRDPLGE